MDPITRGETIQKLAEVKGVRLGRQGRQKAEVEKTATLRILSEEVGIPERTIRRDLRLLR